MKNCTNALVPFNFHGDTNDVVEKEGMLWVSVRRICEALGIDDRTQRRKLQSAAWARGVIMTSRDAKGRNQEVFLCDLDSLPIWFASITPSKVAPEVRDKLVLYQNEAARVLRDHFLGNPGHQHRQREDIRTMAVREREEIGTLALRREKEIETLALPRQKALALIRLSEEFGILSKDYFTRYAKHSIALVDGTEASSGPRRGIRIRPERARRRTRCTPWHAPRRHRVPISHSRSDCERWRLRQPGSSSFFPGLRPRRLPY